jgi:signal transduction histidine kinase
MTLHEAILEVLIRFNKSATTREIADYINQTGIYIRGDKGALTASQVRARVNNYPKLFSVDANEGISAITSGENDLTNSLPWAILNILRNTLAHSHTGAIYINLAICSLLIYFRKSDGTVNFATFFSGLKLSNTEVEEIENAIKSIPIADRTRIRNLIASSNLHSLPDSKFKLLFQNWLSMHGTIRMDLGQFNTPARINNILSSLVAGHKNHLKVFDPFAGVGSTLGFLNEVLGSDTYFDAQDINQQTALLGKLNLIGNGIKRFEYYQKDSIQSEYKSGYDLILTTPPFGLKFELSSLDLGLQQILDLGTKGQRPVEYNVIRQSINALKDTGKAVIIVPESFLFSTQQSASAFKINLIKRGLIEKIISLPVGAFHPYSGVKSSILVINKANAGSTHEISFIEIAKKDYDAIPEYFAPQEVNLRNSIVIKVEDILYQNGNLEINRYKSWTNPKSEAGDSKKYVKLKSITTIWTSFGNINRNYLVSAVGIPYIGVSDLAKSDSPPFIDTAKVDRFVDDSLEIRDNYSKYFVPQNALLVAKAGSNLNPSVYSDDRPLLANENVFCLTVDSNIVDPLFLATELKENYVKEQLDLIRRGVTIPSLRKIDLLELEIWLPSFEEQKKIANKRLSATLSAFNQDRKVDEQNLTNEIIAAFKHEFGNLKNPLFTGITNLEDFLKDKMDIDQERISQRPGARNIKQVLDGLKHIATEMGGIIDDMVDAIGSEKKLVKTNIFTFFSDLESKICDGKCHIKIDNSISKKDFFDIDPNLIYKAFRNLVNNAEKHGYDDLNTERNILFKVWKSSDREHIVIDFINDGKPFKDGFSFNDYVSFGKKSGSHSGSGIGGYIINKIIKDHDGTFEDVDVTTSTTLETINNKDILKGIHFVIRLPIYND